MAQLIQMRQRIKAIETIKKITHAMRLISMSTHSRLKTKEVSFSNYQKAINNLFADVHAFAPDWQHPILYPSKAHKQKELIILVGSQKGLCGGFNTNLLKFFERRSAKQKTPVTTDYIAVGRKAINYLKETHAQKMIAANDTFNMLTLGNITRSITREIMDFGREYTHVKVFSNVLKTFFSQKPEETPIIPFQENNAQRKRTDLSDYVWENTPHEVLDALARQSLEAHVQYMLFQSLLAEQAARFISMDSSTRNANNLLDTTKLQYNKLRQAKITKELTELTGSF